MIFPLNANKIEQLDLDPVKKIDGYVWYNKVEKVYKSYVGDETHIFITDKSFGSGGLVERVLDQHQFTVTFTEAYRVIIKHNRNNRNFVCSVYDEVENCILPSSVEIIDENEISVDFIDPVTGHIFLYFE